MQSSVTFSRPAILHAHTCPYRHLEDQGGVVSRLEAPKLGLLVASGLGLGVLGSGIRV